MTNFLLVHGSCHGAWCWRDVLPLLNVNGHTASAIDLPCHGDDTTNVADASIDNYVNAILSAASAPTILVGHSLGGMFITAAAEKDPTRFSHLVYVCAWLPFSGHSARDMRDWAPSNPLADAVRFTKDRMATTFAPEMVGSKFYHDCPPETLEFAQQNLCPEPLAPQVSPVDHGKNFASVPKSYVVCEQDRAIDPAGQRSMAARLPETNQHSLTSAHSPFFAQPDKLSSILLTIAEAQ